MEPESPALAGGFFTTAPPGKSYHSLLCFSSSGMWPLSVFSFCPSVSPGDGDHLFQPSWPLLLAIPEDPFLHSSVSSLLHLPISAQHPGRAEGEVWGSSLSSLKKKNTYLYCLFCVWKWQDYSGVVSFWVEVFFFFIYIFYWSAVDLPCFRYTASLFSYTYTHVLFRLFSTIGYSKVFWL